MTKSELILNLAARFPQLVVKDAELSVKAILDSMTDNLAAGERIEIRGFGSFSLNYRPPRLGRNPKTGKEVTVTARRVVTFKSGQKLKAKVEGYESKNGKSPSAGTSE